MLCEVCSKRASFECSRCHRAFYCSKEHGDDHWYDEHSEECMSLAYAAAGKREREEEGETSVSKQAREETCPRDVTTEVKNALQETLGDVAESDMEDIKRDDELNATCRSILNDLNSLADLCRDFMNPDQIGNIMARIYTSRSEKKNADIDWELPELFRGLTQYHEAYFRLLSQDEPSTESGVRTLGAHLKSLTDDFVEFYKIFCPYMRAFVTDELRVRDSSILLLKANIRKIDARIYNAEMGTGITSIPRRTLRAGYNLVCKVFKALAARKLVFVVNLLLFMPYHRILMSDATEAFVKTIETYGYSVPAEYFDMRLENWRGWASWMNVRNAESARSTSGILFNPWAQSVVNFAFTASIWAANISRTLQALTSHGFTFMCASLLAKLGLPVMAAGITATVAAFILSFAVTYFVYRIMGWYEQYRKDNHMRDDMENTGKNFRILVTQAAERAKLRQ